MNFHHETKYNDLYTTHQKILNLIHFMYLKSMHFHHDKKYINWFNNIEIKLKLHKSYVLFKQRYLVELGQKDWPPLQHLPLFLD